MLTARDMNTEYSNSYKLSSYGLSRETDGACLLQKYAVNFQQVPISYKEHYLDLINSS